MAPWMRLVVLRPSLVVAAVLAVVATGACSSPDDGTIGSDDADVIDPGSPRGKSIVQYPVEGRPNEICVLPNHLVGADYAKEQVVGWDVVERGGGRVALAPLVDGRSTSGVIERILEAYGKDGRGQG